MIKYSGLEGVSYRVCCEDPRLVGLAGDVKIVRLR